jgi:hypothetical protein
MRTADGRIVTDRRQFLGTGLKTAAATGLLAKISVAQPSLSAPTTITGTLVNVISPGVTETSQITVTTNTDPNTPPGQFTEDVVYTGSIKFVSDGEMVALKFTIPPMVANGLDAFQTDPLGNPNKFVIVSNGITNFDENNSLFSMTVDNAAGTSGQISTSSTGSTFTFMMLQGAATMQARKKRRTVRVANTGQDAPADPPPVIVAVLLGLAVIVCAVVVLIKALIDDCVKQAATVCGNAGVKSVETDITLGFNFKTWKIGCTSECIIMCNQSS